MTTDDEVGSSQPRSAQARQIFRRAVRGCRALLSFLWQLPWTGIVTRLVGVAAAVWIATLMVMDIFGQKTSVEPISVPKSLAEAGFTRAAVEEVPSADLRYGFVVRWGAAGREAQRRIELITADVEVGRVYEGRVARLMDFGAFVTILPGRDGLVHISQISEERVERVGDKLKEGDVVRVKVLEVDRQGRVRLSMRNVDAA